MASQTNRVEDSGVIFGLLEGADATAGQLLWLTSSTAAGIPSFSPVDVAAWGASIGRLPVFVLDGKATGGAAVVGDTIRVRRQGIIRTVPGTCLDPPGPSTWVFVGDVRHLSFTAAVAMPSNRMGVVGWVTRVNALDYDC